MSGVDSRTREQRIRALLTHSRLQAQSAQRAGNLLRLDDLKALVTRLEQELDLPLTYPPKKKPRIDNVAAHLAQLGVTSNQVKVWAVAAGLIDQVNRGRISAYLVDAYDQAHNQEDY